MFFPNCFSSRIFIDSVILLGSIVCYFPAMYEVEYI